MNRYTASRNVLVELALLPPLGPQPVPPGRYRQGGWQLDHAAGALGHLQLHSRLVQEQPMSNVRRQRDGAVALDAEVARLYL